MNNLENKTFQEIIAWENMVYGGTMLDSITHSISTKHCRTPAHLPEPSLFALYCPCKAPVKIGIMLWNMWHIVIIWQNQILIGHKTTQAIFPDDFVILRRVIVSLQDGRRIFTAYFSAWKTGKMERLDALLLIKPIAEPGNEPPISKS